MPEWRSLLPLTLIVSLGLLLRLWGIDWSLPDAHHPLTTYHPDELVNLNAALAADIPHGQFDIGFYNYGAFYFYLVSFAQILGRAYGLIPHAQQAADASSLAAMIASAPERAGLFLVGRLVTALLGTVTVGVIFALGNRIYGRRVGCASALLYAVAPLAVVHGHFLTVDVPATLFVALALLWAVRLLERQTWSDYIWAAVWSGLAAATKYNAGLVLVAPVMAHLLNRTPGACRQHRGAQFVVLLCVAALAFLIGCPGPILNLDAFWNGLPNYPGSGVRYELFVHSRTGHGDLFIDTGPGWWYHLVVSLPFSLGLPLCLLALAGLVYACRRFIRGDRVLLIFFAVYYIAIGLSAVRFARYLLPLFPVLCVFAARLVCEPRVDARGRRVWLAIGCVVGGLAGLYSLTLVAQMARTDPRDAAAGYLNAHTPQEASVAFATVPWFYSPPLSPYFGALAAPVRRKAAQETTRYQLRIPETEWDTAVLSPPPDVIVLSNIETMHAADRLHLTAPTRFLRALPPGYRAVRFGPGTIAGLTPHGAIIPEDLLYIMPTITLHTRP